MPKTGELYLDIGAPNEDWACSSVCPGDYAVFVQRPLCLGEHMLLAKAMSRSMGCAVLLALMSRELPVDVCFSFSTQRHVGLAAAPMARRQGSVRDWWWRWISAPGRERESCCRCWAAAR